MFEVHRYHQVLEDYCLSRPKFSSLEVVDQYASEFAEFGCCEGEEFLSDSNEESFLIFGYYYQ